MPFHGFAIQNHALEIQAHNITKYDKQQGLNQAWHGKTEIMAELTLENNTGVV